jgi:hypothetical protein
MLKVDSALQASKLPTMAGKSYTVITSEMINGGLNNMLVLAPEGSTAGKGLVILKVEGAQQLPYLAGQTFTVGKSPMIAGHGASNWLVLKPSAAFAAKGTTVAAKTVVTTAGISAAKVGASKTAATGAGTIFSGTGLSLGLGLGLGAWGPLILTGIVGAGIYGYMKHRAGEDALADEAA